VVHIVPLTNTLVDMIPRVLGEAVVKQHKVVDLNEWGWSLRGWYDC